MSQTRDFFEQQREREAEGDGWTWPEGSDPISLLDKSISLKVSPSPCLHLLILPPPDIQECGCEGPGGLQQSMQDLETHHWRPPALEQDEPLSLRRQVSLSLRVI